MEGIGRRIPHAFIYCDAWLFSAREIHGDGNGCFDNRWDFICLRMDAWVEGRSLPVRGGLYLQIAT